MSEPNFLERVKQIVRALRGAEPEKGRTDPAEAFRSLAQLVTTRVAEATGLEVTGEPVEQAPGEGYIPTAQAGGGPAVARVPIKGGEIGEVE
jgi:hypothetical protein